MTGSGHMDEEEEKQLAAKVTRDEEYRIAALHAAVARAGQSGGVEDVIDVLGLAELYYNWLRGKETLERPALEKILKGET